MTIGIELVNFDQLFFESSGKNPIIINDIRPGVVEEKSRLDKELLTVYQDTDLMATLPSCSCGELTGQFRLGVRCTSCGGVVKSQLDQPIEPVIWIAAPIGVDSLINPHFWRLMTDVFIHKTNNKKFNIIKWYCNTDYHPDLRDHAKALEEVTSFGFPRGLNNFVQNHRGIIQAIADSQLFSKQKQKKIAAQEIIDLMNLFPDCLFCSHIPIPNKTILVIENTKFGTYMDASLDGVLDAVANITGIDTDTNSFTSRMKENRIAKTIESLSEFYRVYEQKYKAGKPGLYRKHIYGTRCYFSFRAVIVSLTDRHRYDEIHIPWALAVNVLKMHLTNFLLADGMCPNEAAAFLNAHMYRYHDKLDGYFKRLIAESPERGIPCLFGRNPSLYRTSLQRMFITKVIPEPLEFAIRYPIKSVSGPNADFDGKMVAVYKLL